MHVQTQLVHVHVPAVHGFESRLRQLIFSSGKKSPPQAGIVLPCLYMTEFTCTQSSVLNCVSLSSKYGKNGGDINTIRVNNLGTGIF